MAAQRLSRPAAQALRSLATSSHCCCRRTPAVLAMRFSSSAHSQKNSQKNTTTSPSQPPPDHNTSGPIDPPVVGELQVGELPGGTFRVEPLRRVGETPATTRARLLYQSRKRGTLESDLLLSTFAAQHLATMTPDQLTQYDRFLDENDWDIYYWVTQEEDGPTAAQLDSNADAKVAPRPSHEWAQTVGTFHPAYRPVPARWQGSEILALLRQHVRERSAGGVYDARGSARDRDGVPSDKKGQGMAFMPPLTHFADK